MHKVVFVLQVIVWRCCSNVALFVKVYSKIISNNCPNSNVKLSCEVQKWFLYIFLDDPKRNCLLLLENEICDLLVVPKDLNSSALVERRRFYEPNVLLTVFEWNTFFSWAASADLSKSVNEVFNTIVIKITGDYKGSRCWVKYTICSLLRFTVLFIVTIKGPNQTGLLADATIYFKMIKQIGARRRCDPLINLVVLTECKIQWLPKKICLRDSIFFLNFIPISSLT